MMNCLLARKVIDLHNIGYELDFVVERPGQLTCVQDNRIFSSESVVVILVDQAFDQLSRKFRYIHTVETLLGDRGLLLSECAQLILIYPQAVRDESPLQCSTFQAY
ncbi:hypothetical protein HQN86_10475 [Pedobacter panaciterrae]|uniref:hypothetical protein n=1 Tax=Pedobacter panaciterrae TaxID=363849 RepID=UPI00155DB87F|nr:hypothetical protein [Pedobacter panaciterrae]NQX54041.1 hypothetical protein [Pedobacter panaciterrae]